MADFNTHGGYFAPAGYMRINEGGSHEENPNGGVQVGVDPQGVPNMLEEGEPVYKDFVFSDNIRAQEQFLVEAGLPKHFAGKLYSEIVDELFAEAEDRPNDPISRNGLDAMLSRVAQAQEAQKAAEEEAQLMEEIRNMSPEEYAALEQAMMAQEQPVEQSMPVEEMVAPEQMAMAPEEQVQPEMMLMGYARGGKINSYGDGEFLKKVRHFFNGPETWTAPDGKEYPIIKTNAPGVGNKAEQIRMAQEGITKWAPIVAQMRKEHGFFAPFGSTALRNLNTYKGMLRHAQGVNLGGLKGTAKNIGTALSSPGAKKAGKIAGWSLAGASVGVPAVVGVYNSVWGDPAVENMPVVTNPTQPAVDTMQVVNPVNAGQQLVGPYQIPSAPKAVSFDDLFNGLKRGGVINKFENGTQYITTPDGQVYQVVERTDDSGRTQQEYIPVVDVDNIDASNRIPEGEYDIRGAGRFLPDDYASYWGRIHAPARGGYSFGMGPLSLNAMQGLSAQNTNVASLRPDTNVPETVSQPTSTVAGMGTTVRTSAPGARRVSATLPAGPEIPVPSVDPILSDAELDYISRAGIDPRSYEAQFGRIPIEPERIPDGRATTTGSLAGYNGWLGNRLKGTPVTDVDSDVVVNDGRNGRPSVLSTLPRYAGAIGSGLLALNTLLQQPDHYDDTPIRPALPTGRILLQDQRYMPMDQNMVTNQIQAQNAANARAILNSGAGPSTGALLAAADYTGGQNLGNALGNVWQANNQERNRVISANNQNAATRAQFYRDLNSQRAQILNNMAMYNRQNALRTAMLNNQAEQSKYNAFGQNLGNALQALSGIGQENFAMNQLNTNTALGWYVGPDGRAYYRGSNWSNCGGLLKKIKK